MGAALIPILASVAGAAATTVINKAMTKKETPAEVITPPTPEPIAESKPMPVADSATALAARKKSMVAQAQRQGRASTILSEQEPSDKLGG